MAFRPALFFLLIFALALSTVHGQFARMSEADEIELGKRAAEAVLKDQPILNEAKIAAYVNDLGLRLVKAGEQRPVSYQFHVLNVGEVNAFALPGGFIFVNRGLLETCETESELAGVLAHEIAHVVARHGASQVQRQQLGSMGAQALGAILGRRAENPIASTAVDLVSGGAFMKFSREAERQADLMGAQMVRDAGYDPHGMVSFFERLETMRQNQPNAVLRFFSSHPQPEQRVEHLSSFLAGIEKPAAPAADSGFAEMRTLVAALPPAPRSEAPALPAMVIGPRDVHGHYLGEERDREVAALFAPVFHQGLAETPRFDWITNFDFDSDWNGGNNWENAADTRFPLRATVYYSVRETATHFFVHYAVFHPRDYKGGRRGATFSDLIREGVRIGGQYDPTGRSAEAVLAHENDLEGVLVVAAKQGEDLQEARLVYVETLAHNKFLQYGPEGTPGKDGIVTVEGRRPNLFIEPKGHGIEAYRGNDMQLKTCTHGVLVYHYTGEAGQPVSEEDLGPVSYSLAPLFTTMWPRALDGENETYGEAFDYGVLVISLVDPAGGHNEIGIRLGKLGSAFRGGVGGSNLARPPWGWFDGMERDRPLGEWFFQPAETIRRHYKLGEEFTAVYLHTRF